MDSLLRLAVVAIILVLLARASRVAWRNRRLAVYIWRRVRIRHVVGSLGLVAVVLVTAFNLLAFVPFTRLGLGSLIGLSGNAVFAPLEEATIRTNSGVAAPTGEGVRAGFGFADVGLMLLTVAFLGGLALLFPWLAYVEERIFREGLEGASLGRELWTALKFGLLHMIMLIPLAAALAVGVAGFVYGRIYRRAYRTAARRTQMVQGPFGIPVVVGPPTAQLRDHAVLESTVWHATFNTTIVALVLIGFASTWFFPA